MAPRELDDTHPNAMWAAKRRRFPFTHMAKFLSWLTTVVTAIDPMRIDGRRIIADRRSPSLETRDTEEESEVPHPDSECGNADPTG